MVVFNLPLLRRIVFATCSVIAVIVLGVAADITNNRTFESIWWAYIQSLAIAAAVLTLITLPVMLVLEWKWSGIFTSMIVAELGWLFILWVLWVSTASRASAINIIWTYDCNYLGGHGCSENRAIEAFSFINWIILLGYSITVLSFAVRSALNGNTRVWFVTVNDVTWSGEKVEAAQPQAAASYAYPLQGMPDQGSQQQNMTQTHSDKHSAV